MNQADPSADHWTWRSRFFAFVAVSGLCVATAILLSLPVLVNRQRDAQASMSHITAVIENATAVEVHLERTISAGRGYLISRWPVLLDQFRENHLQTQADLGELAGLLAGDQKQLALLSRLRSVAHERVSTLEAAIGRRSEPSRGNNNLGSEARAELMAEALVLIDAIKSAEARRLEATRVMLAEAARHMLIGLTSCAMLITGATIGLILNWRRDRRHAAELRSANATLEVRVRERIASLVASDARLSDGPEQHRLQQQVLAQAERQAEAAEVEAALCRESIDLLYVVRVEETEADVCFRFDALSPAFDHWTGIAGSELLGRNAAECLPPPLIDWFLSAWRTCLEAAATISCHGTLKLPKQPPREVERQIAPVMHPSSGRIVRLVGACRDVTARNRTEAQLRHNQKMEALGCLAAGVAHDFNNILQVIIGALELVLDDVATDAPAREFADMAIQTAERGSYLTQHLLSYAHKQTLAPKPVDLSIFLTDFRKLLARVLGPHVAIDLAVEPDVPPVLADPGQLQTALLNLAINAADAMKVSGVLRVEAKPVTRDGAAWAELSVSDTGFGMDKETLARATDPFFTTKGAEGTGLGLSMVKGFVEQSGGTLLITSAPGQGTKVAMCLPPASSPEEQAEPAASRGASGRLLLVDDAAEIGATAGAQLGRAGFHVTVARDGAEALSRLDDEGPFDVLITDFAMPGLNGAALVSACRQRQPRLAAVLITGYADVKEAADIPGNVTLLNKPFSRGTLLNAIQQATAEMVTV